MDNLIIVFVGGVTSVPLADAVVVKFHQHEDRSIFHADSIRISGGQANRNLFFFRTVFFNHTIADVGEGVHNRRVF